MSAPTTADRRRALRRAARRELEAGKVLGVERVHRGGSRRLSAPDLKPVALDNGKALGVEVKSRKRLPKLLVDGLAQARRYFRGATIPLVVVSELGGRAIAALDLRHLVELLGVDVPLVARPRRRRAERQLELFGPEPTTLPQDASAEPATSNASSPDPKATHTPTSAEEP